MNERSSQGERKALAERAEQSAQASADGDGAEIDDAWGEPAAPPLNAAEAQALKARLSSVSPWRIVAMQGVAGLVCVAVAAAVGPRPSAGWSALYGAAVAVVPNALLARGMAGQAASAAALASRFMVWELVKIGVAVSMLAVAASVVPQLSWLALLLTMIVCMKMNWLALLLRGRR